MDSGMVTMSECYVREDAIPYHSWSANRNEWLWSGGRQPVSQLVGQPE